MNRDGKRMEPEATRSTEYESATDFQDSEALHNIVLDNDDQLLHVSVFKWMMKCDDRLRRFDETLTTRR